MLSTNSQSGRKSKKVEKRAFYMFSDTISTWSQVQIHVLEMQVQVL